jgi:two-component system response regulator
MSDGASILIVEDSSDDIQVALRALRRAGVTVPVAVARDGQEALEALGLEPDRHARPPVRPRVVFLDLKLPRVDGWEVLRRVRQCPATAAIPVVVTSSSDERADIDRCYALGANSYLVKRFDTRGPGAYLAEAARYWVELNHPPPRGGVHVGANGADR